MSPQTQRNKICPELRIDALLASFFGLSGEVFPALRALYVDWDKELVYLYFYYDGEISEDDHESAECVATQIISHFSDHLLEIEILRIDYPRPLPNAGILVYQRREPLLSNQINEHKKLLKTLLAEDFLFSLRVKVLLSFMIGLIGNSSPVLRCAKIKWDEEKIHLYFYYDGAISEEDHESAKCVATEMVSDFPEYKLGIDIFRWDYPKLIPKEEVEIVYFRKEAPIQTSS